MLQDPFSPGNVADPLAGLADPATYDKVRNQWNTFMADPQGRAALLSAGLAMMQPPSFGDTGASQIGRAIGAAGESATANQMMDLKKGEAASKDELRQARAESSMMNAETRASAAEARAGAAGARNDASATRLQIAQERLASQGTLANLRAKIGLSEQYRKMSDNARLMGSPVPSWQEFLSSRGLGNLTTGTVEEGDDADVPVGAQTTPNRSAQDAQALAWANANPTDPRAAAIKKKLGVQ